MTVTLTHALFSAILLRSRICFLICLIQSQKEGSAFKISLSKSCGFDGLQVWLDRHALELVLGLDTTPFVDAGIAGVVLLGEDENWRET